MLQLAVIAHEAPSGPVDPAAWWFNVLLFGSFAAVTLGWVIYEKFGKR